MANYDKLRAYRAEMINPSGIVKPDAGTGFDFVDGAGGDDSIDRNDGGNWIIDGYRVGGQITVASATTGANNGSYTITSISASSIGIPTGSITADTADNTVTFSRVIINYNLPNGGFFRSRDTGDVEVILLDDSTYIMSGLTDGLLVNWVVIKGISAVAESTSTSIEVYHLAR